MVYSALSYICGNQLQSLLLAPAFHFYASSLLRSGCLFNVKHDHTDVADISWLHLISYQYHACNRNKKHSVIITVYLVILGAHHGENWCIFFFFLQSSSDDCDPHEGIHEGKEGKYRLQVTQFVQRLEYWHKELTNTLVTSITVMPVHGRAVAYLGTADGRHIQVKKSRCLCL